MATTARTATTTTGRAGVEALVRQDAALLEDDLREFIGSLPTKIGSLPTEGDLYGAALSRSLYAPVADALASKVGQAALPPTPRAPGHGGPPLRPSIVYWAYRNYRGFPDETDENGETGKTGHAPGTDATDLALIRRTAVAVRILLKAAVVLDDIQDGSDVRYGEPALHRTHGVPLALNAASWLIMAALRHAADPAVVAGLVRAVGNGFTGQAGDMSTRTARTRAELLAAPHGERVRFWESVAALKTGTLFWMPLDAAVAGLGVVEDERRTLDDAMRRLGLASQLFNDLTDVVPELGGANTHEDFDGLSNRVFLELADSARPSAQGEQLKAFVLGHPGLQRTLLELSSQAVELKRSVKEDVHRVCRSARSAAYFDVTIERKGHLIDRLHETVRQRAGV
ncbi:polyprenyl synthetase family protein [Streptomyces sp. DG2A-72]|uniref:polyprenyl synthetase family protein n=1 Tax=Streptomyces sp. DG2A-72 TaxID=3051386 RepID=UPI00265BA4D8|nr:polyprenyl synthetase family protein [Streptomyces sp. DG2A-72]MDO0932948.1 polyprenyl synthetase family protein [Streptomyces sp. DG2A-72]